MTIAAVAGVLAELRGSRRSAILGRARRRASGRGRSRPCRAPSRDWSVAVGPGRLAEVDDADAGRRPRRSARSSGSPQRRVDDQRRRRQRAVAAEVEDLVGRGRDQLRAARRADHAPRAEQLRGLDGDRRRACRSRRARARCRRAGRVRATRRRATRSAPRSRTRARSRRRRRRGCRTPMPAPGVDDLGHQLPAAHPHAAAVLRRADDLGADHVRRRRRAAVEAAVADRDVDRVQRGGGDADEPAPCGASISSTCGTPPISCRRAARTAIDYEQAQEAAVATVTAPDPVAPRNVETRTPVLPSNTFTCASPPAPVPATIGAPRGRDRDAAGERRRERPEREQAVPSSRRRRPGSRSPCRCRFAATTSALRSPFSVAAAATDDAAGERRRERARASRGACSSHR